MTYIRRRLQVEMYDEEDSIPLCMKIESVEDMNVTELKDQLRLRDASISGLKAVLKQRLVLLIKDTPDDSKYDVFGNHAHISSCNFSHQNMVALSAENRIIQPLLSYDINCHVKDMHMTKYTINSAPTWHEVDYKASGSTKEWDWQAETQLIRFAIKGDCEKVRQLLFFGACIWFQQYTHENKSETALQAAKNEFEKVEKELAEVKNCETLPWRLKGPEDGMRHLNGIYQRKLRYQECIDLLEASIPHWTILDEDGNSSNCTCHVDIHGPHIISTRDLYTIDAAYHQPRDIQALRADLDKVPHHAENLDLYATEKVILSERIKTISIAQRSEKKMERRKLRREEERLKSGKPSSERDVEMRALKRQKYIDGRGFDKVTEDHPQWAHMMSSGDFAQGGRRCWLCNKNIGIGFPMTQHINGKKHKELLQRKMKEYNSHSTS